MSIFRNIVDAAQLEESVRDTLKAWMPTYLRELEDQRGVSPLGQLPPPRAYIITEDMDKEPEDQLPAIVVVSPGLVGEPTMSGDGYYEAPWQVGVGIFASANTRANTSILVRRYCAAIRAILLQKRPDVVTRVDWTDESYDDALDFDDDRTIGAGQVVFEMRVGEVVNRRAGPATPVEPDPETQPGSDWGIVQEVFVTEEPVEEVT